MARLLEVRMVWWSVAAFLLLVGGVALLGWAVALSRSLLAVHDDPNERHPAAGRRRAAGLGQSRVRKKNEAMEGSTP